MLIVSVMSVGVINLLNWLTGGFLVFISFAWGMLATRMLDDYMLMKKEDKEDDCL